MVGVWIAPVMAQLMITLLSDFTAMFASRCATYDGLSLCAHPLQRASELE
jgi:hypothetical protein